MHDESDHDTNLDALEPRVCSECHWMFVPKRNAVTCSDECYTRRSRRLRSGAEQEPVVWRISDPEREDEWTIHIPIGPGEKGT